MVRMMHGGVGAAIKIEEGGTPSIRQGGPHIIGPWGVSLKTCMGGTSLTVPARFTTAAPGRICILMRGALFVF